MDYLLLSDADSGWWLQARVCLGDVVIRDLRERLQDVPAAFGRVMSLVPALRGGNSEGIKRRYSLFSSHVCWRETTLAPLPTLCLSCTSTSLTTHHSQQGNNGHPWILHHSFSSEDITIQTVSDNCIQRSGRGLWGSKHIPTSCSLFTIYYDKNEKKNNSSNFQF